MKRNIVENTRAIAVKLPAKRVGRDFYTSDGKKISQAMYQKYVLSSKDLTEEEILVSLKLLERYEKIVAQLNSYAHIELMNLYNDL